MRTALGFARGFAALFATVASSVAAVSLALFGVLASACGDPPTHPDAGDAGEVADAGDPSDAGPSDAGAPPEAGPPFTVSIVAPDSPLVANAGEILVRAFVDRAAPELVALRLDGEPLASLPPPFEHTLDLGSLAEGEHDVVASATVDGVTVPSEPLLIVVDRTGPSVVAIDPPLTDLYRLGTVVTVTFDESLDPASVVAPSTGLAIGSGAGFDSTLELDETGMVLTITPTGPDMVAVGSVELSLGGADPAGNPVMPFEAMWYAPRWIPVGGPVFTLPAAESFPDENLEVRATDTGEPVVAALVSTGTGTHHVRVARFDGASWAPTGDGACEGAGILPPFAEPLGSWDLELEPDGTPVVAARDIADTSAPLVRFCRFDGTSWLAGATPASIADLRELDFAISSTGDRIIGASTFFAGPSSELREPEVFRNTAGGGIWSRLRNNISPEHRPQWLFEVEYDRADRIIELHVDSAGRMLTHRDPSDNVVLDTYSGGLSARARLVETSSGHAMLAGCRLIEPGSAPLLTLTGAQCDAAVSPTDERRLVSYVDDLQLGLAMENAAGAFDDLGLTDLNVSATGGACTPPSAGCRFPVRAAFLTYAPTGRLLAIAHSGSDVHSFELNILSSVP